MPRPDAISRPFSAAIQALYFSAYLVKSRSFCFAGRSTLESLFISFWPPQYHSCSSIQLKMSGSTAGPPEIDDLVATFHPVTPSSIIAVGAVMPSLALIAVSLRFYVKVKKRTVGLDDWLILVALVICCALGITLIVGSAVKALGQPTPLGDGPLGFFHVLNDAIVTTEKIKYAFNLLQMIAFGAVKLSVLFFYRRIFRGKIFDIASWTMIGVVLVWTFGFFFTMMFECRTEFWAFWSTLSDLLTHCLDDVKFQRVLSISDVVSDILILLIPIPIIWQLNLSIERKVAVCGVFLMGSLAVAFGIVRLVVYDKRLGDAFAGSQGILLLSTWFYWSLIEMGMAIVAACLPTLRPLFGSLGTFSNLTEAIRSLFSMRSLSSQGSSRLTGRRKPQDGSRKLKDQPNLSEEQLGADRLGEQYSMQDVRQNGILKSDSYSVTVV
ncbi:hypothetical protein EYC84_002565 [Monilinia fructicola]|uniref:Rhodopsin domain-containing protein n=1 Tax=Monilinia fructicola TaxID=38448 RepID=A0A5M9JPB8_MONFR|nr:hypothetical protein EYC84_002565 [Monilinia fructicola]